MMIDDSTTGSGGQSKYSDEAFEAMRQLYKEAVTRAEKAERYAEGQLERGNKAIEAIMDYYNANVNIRVVEAEAKLAKCQAECERLRAALMEDNAD